jgi:hypothetical protein
MKLLRKVLGFSTLGLAILTCSVWSSASASVITVTYDGVVSDGTDATGLFGPAGTALGGESYQLTYTFDTSKGALVPHPNGTELSGGPGSIGYSSPGMAVLTINGRSVAINVDENAPSQGLSHYYALDYGSYVFTEQRVWNNVNTSADYTSFLVDTYINDYTYAIPTTLDVPYSLNLGPGVDVGSGFNFFDHIWSSGIDVLQAYGDLNPQTVTVSIAEPPAWSFMLIGLSGLCVFAHSGRWRKKRHSASARVCEIRPNDR